MIKKHFIYKETSLKKLKNIKLWTKLSANISEYLNIVDI